MEEDGGGGAGVDTAGLFGGVNFSGNGAALHTAAAVAADAPEEESPDVCRLARMALDVQDLMSGYRAPDGSFLVVRIGLHYGETVGGVVGQKMLRYHLFGPPLEGVNRMEQSCKAGGVRCSEAFAAELRNQTPGDRPEEFTLEEAGEVEMEDGIMRMAYALTFTRHTRNPRRSIVHSSTDLSRGSR
uniref:Guanylate cyclase domain-containing protein n=1 Tax=Mantoniella antarctica TaxID=81844 RepID=A0A7S0S7Y4_9CHLO